MHNEDLNIIKKQIFGETLTIAEQTRFDQQMANDAEFQKTFADYERTKRTIRRAARQEMRDKLVTFETTGTLTKKEEKRRSLFSILMAHPEKIRKRVRWQIGMTAAVLLVVALWQFQKPSVTFETILTDTQYRTFNYLDFATVRSKKSTPTEAEKAVMNANIAYLTTQYGAENAQKLANAMIDLKAQRYAEAATALANLPFVNDHDSMRLSRADAYLGANELEKAMADYTKIAEKQTPPDGIGIDDKYKDLPMRAEWHLALAYFKKGEWKESRWQMEKIAQTEGHLYQKEAQEVLTKWGKKLF